MGSSCPSTRVAWITPLLGLLILLTGGLTPPIAVLAGHESSHGPATASVSPQTREINDAIAELWKQNHLKPSKPATDYQFIRRATLDIIGRIATTEEIKRFLNDPPATRRSQLIERLLNSEEYARNWAEIWTVWLIMRSGPAAYHEELRDWLQRQFADPEHHLDKTVTELLTATGKTNEDGAVNYVLAHLGEPIPGRKQHTEGQFNMVPVTSRTTRLFLGVQVQCAQCHDHPLNPEWKQQHFWGVNAFFRQVERKGNPMMIKGPNQPSPELELTDNSAFNTNGLVLYERRNAVLMPARPVFLDGKKWSANSPLNRRQQLAQLVVENDYFPRAMVNRLWGHFFGKGLNAPGAVDDFGEHNPITNPRLLDYLSSQFKQYSFDPRQLIRWICNSEAYGLSTVSNSTNDKPEAEPYFSRMLLKPMTPEELFESIMIATGADAPETPLNKKKLRDQWMKSLIVTFGDDEQNETTFNGTVVQALLMMNGPELNQALMHKDRGTIVLAATRRGSNWRSVMEELYLSALNRRPTGAEYQEVYRKLPIRVASKDPLAPWEDLLWALINSNEFILNH